MTTSVPTSEPVQFVGGDTVAWTRTLSAYPPSQGWSLHYRLLGLLVDAAIVDAGASGVFSLAFAPSDTDQILLETTARLAGWVTNVAGETHTIFDGVVRILPNVRFASTVADLQTHVERVLAACEARIEGRITADVARYGREGAFVDKLAITDVLKIQGIYKGKQWRAENPGKLAPVNVVRFANPGRSNPAERLAWPGMDPS